jgi:hypothetical protein
MNSSSNTIVKENPPNLVQGKPRENACVIMTSREGGSLKIRRRGGPYFKIILEILVILL